MAAALQRRLAGMSLQASTSAVTMSCRACATAFASATRSSFTAGQTAGFHSTTPTQEKKRKLQARMRKKANLSRRHDALQKLRATVPDPVRGYGPNNERLWLNSELRRILLTPDEVYSGSFTDKPMLKDIDPRDARLGPLGAEEFKALPVPGPLIARNASSTRSGASAGLLPSPVVEQISAPAGKARTSYLNFGLTPADAQLALETLPQADTALRVGIHSTVEEGVFSQKASVQQIVDEDQADKLSRIIDLRNANARGIRFENIRRIIRRFGQGEGSGRTEVQDHLQHMRRDLHSKRGLRALVMQRAKLLKYLKRLDLARYVACLRDIGVEQRAVEGEVVVR